MKQLDSDNKKICSDYQSLKDMFYAQKAEELNVGFPSNLKLPHLCLKEFTV